MAQDPVCGMEVDPSTAKHISEHAGQAYYFCAPGCKKAFEAEPGKYLAPTYRPSTYMPDDSIETSDELAASSA